MESIYKQHKPETTAEETYEDTQKAFITTVRTTLSELKSEITTRNDEIKKNDEFIYGDAIRRALNIPLGHDFTPVNWLRRTVEIHKTQFMGRPFQVISTYDTKDISDVDDQEKQRIMLENKKQNVYAELRKNAIDAIIRDNGGHSMFMEGAESGSAIGSFVIKAWYDKDEKKYVLSPVEAVENCYAVWNKDDFRSFDAFAYVYQISKMAAMDQYGVGPNVQLSKLGSPIDYIGDGDMLPGTYSQPMVSVMEVTGKIAGWGSDKGKIKRVTPGKENNLNAVIVGDCVYAVIDDEKKLPRYYIFPNKKQRRRPWGAPDVSDSARLINLTYIETLSDWRTVAAKVNFPKYKMFNFGPDAQLPKMKSRAIQAIPLGEGQDMQELQQGDANQVDFKSQMEELKEQFVRETGISRVLFDDPSVTLNSNQALLTSMKPTSDIAETKKQLWGPIIQQMFVDAMEVLAAYEPSTFGELNDGEWELKIQWPSVMQKEDPVYQQMLLNRFNAKTMSLKTFLEAQGETKEEIDRIEEELSSPVTAAILGNQVPLLAQQLIAPPQPDAPVDEKPRKSVNVSSKEMSPDQIERIVAEATTTTNDDAINTNQPAQPANTPGVNSNGGTSAPAQVDTQANNQEGTGVVSQPGSGATSAGPQGAIDQTNQNAGM